MDLLLCLLIFFLLPALLLFVIFQLLPQIILGDLMFPDMNSTSWPADAGVITGLLFVPALMLVLILGAGLDHLLPADFQGTFWSVEGLTVPTTLVAASNFLAALARIRKYRHPKHGFVELWSDPASLKTVRNVGIWALLSAVPMGLATALCGFGWR